MDEKPSKYEPSKNTVAENVLLVNADDVWDSGVTGKDVIVAVIDSGVNYNHIDLADHLWDGGEEFPYHGYDIYYDDNDPMDNYGHGTHCAGTICGDGTSGTATGVASDARLMCVKAISNNGSGSVRGVSSGIEWAVEHHADVLSLSLGFHQTSYSEKLMLRRVCENTFLLDVVASVAVGNAGNDQWIYTVPNNVGLPGGCPSPWLHPEQLEQNAGGLSCVVAVGATDYFEDGYLYSWIHNCSIYDTSFDMCEAVANLELTSSQDQSCHPSFVWDAPALAEVLHYEIYRNSRFMGVTEENYYTDETASDSVFYIYSVCPVYEGCKGLMSHVAVNHVDNVGESNKIKASVYPNPSENKFNIICDNMRRVTVFNMMGTVVMDAQVDGDRYTVDGLCSGVYFIKITTDNGNMVKKVVKL